MKEQDKQTYDIIVANTKKLKNLPPFLKKIDNSTKNDPYSSSKTTKTKQIAIASDITKAETAHLKKILQKSGVKFKIQPHTKSELDAVLPLKFVRSNIALYASIKNRSDYKISQKDYFCFLALTILLSLLTINIFISVDKSDYELHRAVIRQDANRIRRILEKNPEFLSVKDAKGRIPIHYVRDDSGVKVLELLLEAKSPINVLDDYGKTPLDYIDKNKNKTVYYIFLKNGAISRRN